MGGQVLELEVDRFIEAKNQAIQARDQAIQDRDQAIQTRDQAIRTKDQAIQKERESNIQILFSIGQEEHFSIDKLRKILSSKYQLSDNEIDGYLNKYWEN